MKRNLLLVGDLRIAMNYGAVATTEALLDLIYVFEENYNIRLIDYRSLKGNTPLKGFPSYKPKAAKLQYLKQLIKKTSIGESLQKIINRRKEKANFNIPARIDDYEEFTKKIMNFEVWGYEKSLIEWADIIIINSEGNIVNGTDKFGMYREGGRYVLYFAYLAKLIYNKPCFIINHTVDPKNRDILKIIKHVYPKLDGVYVREKLSLELLSSMGIDNAKYVPDALWTHNFINDKKAVPPKVLSGFDFKKPYICIGDSSGIKNKYGKVKWDIIETYTNLIKLLKMQGYQIVFIDGYGGNNTDILKVIETNQIRSVNIYNCNYHQLYYVLKNAKLFISGRWHASIISLLANTPILLWGSDSHKTEALYKEIDYPYEFFDVSALPLNIDRIVKTAMDIIEDNHECVWENVENKTVLARKNVNML